MTPSDADLGRLRGAYADRARGITRRDVYSPFNLAHLFMLQSRQRAVLPLLHRNVSAPLNSLRVLEVGCGQGGVLLEYLSYGVAPEGLHGVDVLLDRLASARARLPHLPLVCADGQRLPYPTGAFDLVLQYTAFSSLLDPALKARLAREMLRVLHPSKGLIVWYDFWLNPTNPQTRGIRPSEIRRLFPGCDFEIRRLTLAPPLVRRLIRVSWLACHMLEALQLFNTHYLVAIQPETQEKSDA
jgi:SAM-dependent methyltransferase